LINSIRAVAFGRAFEVRSPEELAPGLIAALPEGWAATSDPPERTWTIEKRDGEFRAVAETQVLGQTPDPVFACHLLSSDLELWVAEHARRRIFVHAGCVAVGSYALVLPGSTHAGKSTLTAALVRAGATYYSDEFAVLAPDGRVHPYPRPLTMRMAPGSRGTRMPITDIGGHAGTKPAAVALVAQLVHDATAGWQVRERSAGAAMLALITNAVAAKSRPRAVMSAIARATTGCVALTGTRGDAEDAAEILLARLHDVT